MGLFSLVFGSENKRRVKKLTAIANQIEALADEYKAKTDEELKAMTGILKERLSNGETLDDILVPAFATVREASDRVLNMRPFFVQLLGGIALHQGRVAEMKTGEGKTLVATLPAYLNALTGNGVHIVTVNEYLAKRDSEWMGKVFNFLGLSVGFIYSQMEREEKVKAYACDILYATNNELGFDYLRDNMVIRLSDRVQRGLNFAIVDEVDSILIDEARTPLIISGVGEKSSDLYAKAAKFVKTLVKEEDYTIDEKHKSINLLENGSFKAERYFGIENLGDADNTDLNHHIQQALKANFIMKKDVDYVVSDGEILIVDEFTGRLMVGRRFSDGLHQAIEAKENVKIKGENQTLATTTFQNFFRLYAKISGMTGTAKTEEDEFKGIYGLDVVQIPPNKPLQRIDREDMAYGTIEAKLNAIVEEIKLASETHRPVLVGTVSVEKSEILSAMLKKAGIKHNVLNAKNHKQEAEIIAQAGRKDTITIATNMAGRGTDILLGGNPEYMARTKFLAKGYTEEEFNLITGYNSQLDSEQAKLKQEYEEILKECKAITDKEKEEVISYGGLLIIGTERHESRRIDNQLMGRAGRQGDVGETVFYLSFEDDLAKVSKLDMFRIAMPKGEDNKDFALSMKFFSKVIAKGQKIVESRNYASRKYVLQYDNVMNKQREVMYAERDKILRGENIHENIINMFSLVEDVVVDESIDKEKEQVEWDKDNFNQKIEAKLLPQGTNYIDTEKLTNWDLDTLRENLHVEVVKAYEAKVERYKEAGLDFDEVERVILLRVLDRLWIDHIDAMQELKKSVTLGAYANIDPVTAYKQQGFDMFEALLEAIQTEAAEVLLKLEVQKMPENKERVGNTNDSKKTENRTVKKESKISRNAPCPCGSGKKYKNCCGK